MGFIQEFKSFLETQGVTRVTLKNYLSDLRFFLNWYKLCYLSEFTPENLDQSVIENFKLQNSPKMAYSSLKRKLSTIRKFAHYLKEHGYLTLNPLDIPGKKGDEENEDLRKIKNYLFIGGVSASSIKNYLGDIKQFLKWADKVILPEAPWLLKKNMYERLDKKLVDEYKERLKTLNLSPLSINRKLSSIRKFVEWAYSEKRITGNFLKRANDLPQPRQPLITLKNIESAPKGDIDLASELKYSGIPPFRLFQRVLRDLDKLLDKMVDSLSFADFFFEDKEKIFRANVTKIPRIQDPLKISNISKSFYDPLSVSLKHLSFPQKIIYMIRFNRPKWYLRYHSYPIVHYIHFAIFVVVMTIIGLIIYQNTLGGYTSVLGTSINPPPRVLSIKQRLLDSSGNPITSPSDVRFAIYDDKEASGSSLLWEEVDRVNPDEDGVFNVVIGQTKLIPPYIFQIYPSLWLGMSVGKQEELRPRQQLAQVGYAQNAQTLENMGIANLNNYTNAVLALDSTGNLLIGGEASHTLEALYGELILSGNKLTLTTVSGTNTNIEISPDGLGIIDIQKPIQNTSNNNNILSALGSVEFDDNVSILATSSGQSAFTINQNDIGPLISASLSGIAKFTVDAFGSTTLAGDLNLSGNNPNIFSTELDSNLSIGTSGEGRLTLQPTSTGDIEFFSSLNNISSSGNLRLTGNIVLASESATTTFGGITYTWPESQTDGYFLKTNGSGNLSWSALPDLITLWDQTNANAGIGTNFPNFKLDVQDSKSATSAAQIFNTSTSNTASGLAIKLGNTSSNTDINNKWVTFEQSGRGIVGLIKGNGASGVTFQGNGVADFAEYLRKDEREKIVYGSVVCLTEEGIVRPCILDNQNIIGITSENPTFLGGENLEDQSIAVGLSGQVLARVSNISGDIKAGDPLTSSIIPGVSAKATREGRIVGRALNKFDSSDCFDPQENFGLIQNNSGKICQGKIYVLLNVSHYEPSFLEKGTQIKNIAIRQSGEGFYELSDELNQAILKVESFQTAIIGNLTAGFIDAQKIITGSIEANTIKIGGENIKDYIARLINNQTEINSPIVEADEVRTNLISPLPSKNLTVKLPQGSSFTIANSTGSSILKVDDEGASLSGRLIANEINSQNLNSDNASVSGTLRAGKIIADTIEGFKEAEVINNYIDLSSSSADLVYANNLRALTGNFVEGLVSQSPSTFADLSIFGQLKIDNSLVLAGNSINVLGVDLELQPLRQGGISIMAGLIYIDTDGNVKFDGNATFSKDVSIKGVLSTNIISPLPDQDITINIGGDYNANFVVKNGTGSALLSLNQSGDLRASGGAYFNKINLPFIKPAFAISPTEVIATGSAGIATISAYQKEITIRNSLVTEKSLIYVTPRTDTGNLGLFLLRQVPGVSFTIGIGTQLAKEISFNWIIIN